MKRDRLVLPGEMSIETSVDLSGRYFIAYARKASIFTREAGVLRLYLKLAAKTPSRYALDSWLETLADMDANKKGAEAPVAHTEVEGSFDPLAHAIDYCDPNYQTKMIV